MHLKTLTATPLQSTYLCSKIITFQGFKMKIKNKIKRKAWNTHRYRILSIVLFVKEKGKTNQPYIQAIIHEINIKIKLVFCNMQFMHHFMKAFDFMKSSIWSMIYMYFTNDIRKLFMQHMSLNNITYKFLSIYLTSL